MPLSSAQVVYRAQKQLYDETGNIWSFSELFRHFNPGIGQIVQLDSKANNVNAPLQCVPGSMQTIPGDATALIDVLYNTNSAGAPGRGIRQADLNTLRASRRDWAIMPPSPNAIHYSANPDDAKRFYLTPPQPDPAGWVQAVTNMVPPDVIAIQVFTDSSGSDAANQAVIHVESTIGLTAGLWVDPQFPGDPVASIPSGAAISSIGTGTVTLSSNLLTALPTGTELTFSSAFPLPDLYAEPEYLYLMFQANSSRNKYADPQRAVGWYTMFLQTMGVDAKSIAKIQAGQTKVPTAAQQINMATASNG